MKLFRALMFFTAVLAIGQVVVWDAVRISDQPSSVALNADQQMSDFVQPAVDDTDEDAGFIPVIYTLASLPVSAQQSQVLVSFAGIHAPAYAIRGPPLA